MEDGSDIYELPDQQSFKRNPSHAVISFSSSGKPESTSQELPKAFSSPLKRGWSCLNVLKCVVVIVVGCLACAGLVVVLISYHTSQSRGIDLKSEIAESFADVDAYFQENFSLLHIKLNKLFANFTILLARHQIKLIANFTTLTDLLASDRREITDLTESLATDQSELIVNFTVLSELLAGGIPPSACTHILALDPSSPSGYYWIRSSTGSAVRVYCGMTLSCGNITGGWMRVAELDMTDSSSQCPVGFSRLSNPSTCVIALSTAACSSVVFATNALLYNRVCDRILAYQRGTTDAFAHHGRDTNLTIDSNYVDGISLTYGSKPRQHIWSFASANNEVGTVEYPSKVCQCSNTQLRVPPPPAFVGEDYFCDSGSSSNPLWDGAGCGPRSTCCSFNSPPWFHRVLSSPTTQDIEMRVCRDEGPEYENIGLSLVEIYVQ